MKCHTYETSAFSYIIHFGHHGLSMISQKSSKRDSNTRKLPVLSCPDCSWWVLLTYPGSTNCDIIDGPQCTLNCNAKWWVLLTYPGSTNLDTIDGPQCTLNCNTKWWVLLNCPGSTKTVTSLTVHSIH